MKLSKLDAAVFVIVVVCLAGVALAAYIGDPARQPIRVAYLHPAASAAQNVWTSEIDNPAARTQLTFSERGVYDFDVSPDGRWLAYGERVGQGVVTLRLLDVPAGRVIDLVDCAALNAFCTSPVFSPDGETLAYQRSEAVNGSYGRSRIWLVDMTGANYDTVPLIADSQVVGHSAVWSADGNTIAFYSADSLESGILIYDFVPRDGGDVQLRFIPSSHGAMGSLAPNGQQIIFPEVVFRGDQVFTHLRIADLQRKDFAAFTDPQGPADDAGARIGPDGETVALARRYTDDRWTPGHQLYLRSLSDATAEMMAIAFDERYNTSYFRWNRVGDRLVMQRFPLMDADGNRNPRAVPEIWVVEIATGEASKIVEDAFLPQWFAH